MTPVSAPPMDDANDTEITLGTGKMLVLFFLLVVVCAVFFGMGYSLGRNSVRSAVELQSTSPSPGRSVASNPAGSAAVTAPQSQPAQEAAPQTPAAGNPAGNSPSAAAPSGAAPDQAGAQPAPPTQTGPGYFVQVAAVSKQEDAEALVEALKARQYPAIIANQPSDKLFHVQVGPFADIKDAETMRAKLVSDGYNPILKK